LGGLFGEAGAGSESSPHHTGISRFHDAAYTSIAHVVNLSRSVLTYEMSTEHSVNKLDQLPPEMIEFALLKTTGALAPRLGRISLAGRKTVLTPGFIGNTSRGVIPHVSPDNFRKDIDLNGVYIPLEDCEYRV
jgi:hypothetical protein